MTDEQVHEIRNEQIAQGIKLEVLVSNTTILVKKVDGMHDTLHKQGGVLQEVMTKQAVNAHEITDAEKAAVKLEAETKAIREDMEAETKAIREDMDSKYLKLESLKWVLLGASIGGGGFGVALSKMLH